MTEGEFQKRAYTKQDIESLIKSRWNETFVDMEDIDEALEAFPQSTKWNSPLEELKSWRKVSLSGQTRAVASWIKSRIETLEWVIEWFGAKEK